MKSTVIKIKLILASLLFLTLVSKVLADAPNPPVNISLDCVGDCKFVLLKWHPAATDSDNDKYRLYIAKGHTDDLSKFKIFWKSEFEDSLLTFDGGFLGANLFVNPGEYSFYMTTIHDSVESKHSQFIFKKFVVNNINIIFVTKPDTVAYVGENYNYNAKADASNDGMVNYVLIAYPKGMTIDMNMGEINWQPKESKNVNVVIKAFLKMNPNVFTFQTFSVNVKQCRLSSGIFGTVKDQNNNPINSGNIQVFKKNFSGDSISVSLVKTFDIENGRFHMFLDQDTYYLHFVGDTFDSKWYESAYEMNDAKPLNLICGDTLFINMKVNLKQKENLYNVSGNVKRASNGSPLQYVMVSFIGINNVSNELISNGAVTDNYGNYKLQLSDKFTYIALARPLDSLHGQNVFLMPQYYEGASEPTSATKIVLTGDRDDINFALIEKTKVNNKISGFIKNDLNKTIPQVTVMAYPINHKNLVDTSAIRTTQSDDNGKYFFDNLLPGNYILLAYKLDKTYIPGYYRDVSLNSRNWWDATKVNVTATTISDKYVIRLLPRTRLNTSAKGFIKGKVYKKTDIIKAYDQPLEDELPVSGVLIFLEDYYHKLVNFTISDKTGDYFIPYLTKGYYKIFADKIGFVEYQQSVYVSTDSDSLNKTLELIDYSNYTDNTDNSVNNENLIYAYPNPASDAVSFISNRFENNDAIEVIDITGKLLIIDKFTSTGNIYSLDCNKFNNGTYILRVTGKKGSSSIPFVIIK